MDPSLSRSHDDSVVADLARLSPVAESGVSGADVSDEQNLNMLALQNTVSQRSILVDLVHSLAADSHESQRTIIENMGSSGGPAPHPVATDAGPGLDHAYGTGTIEPPFTQIRTDFDFGAGTTTAHLDHDSGPGEVFVPRSDWLTSDSAPDTDMGVVDMTVQDSPAAEMTAHPHWPIELVTDTVDDDTDENDADDPTD